VWNEGDGDGVDDAYSKADDAALFRKLLPVVIVGNVGADVVRASTGFDGKMWEMGTATSAPPSSKGAAPGPKA
jgi:hypothetical protein